MEESNANPFSAFMEKQINKKTDKSQKTGKTFFGDSSDDQKNDKEQKVLTAEEEAAAEELEEAKKLSRNKAAAQNQTRMLKKLFLENLLKYALIMTFLIILAIAAIKLGPTLLKSLNGIISKLFLMALNK